MIVGYILHERVTGTTVHKLCRFSVLLCNPRAGSTSMTTSAAANVIEMSGGSLVRCLGLAWTEMPQRLDRILYCILIRQGTGSSHGGQSCEDRGERSKIRAIRRR